MTGVAQTCAWRILHSDGLHPCYLQVLQHFLLGDYAKCLWFCEWMQPQARLCTTFFAWMTLNLPGWCHQHKEFAFLRTGKSTWCCTMSFWTLMFGWRVFWSTIWPHVIKGCLTAPYFRNFLENELLIYLEDMSLATQGWIRLQHEGALPHFDREVTELFNENCEGRWVGRYGPVAWSTQLPDLNQLHFFLLDYMELRRYHNGKPDARHQLLETISEVTIWFRNYMEHHSMGQHLDTCKQCNGGHFEHVLL